MDRLRLTTSSARASDADRRMRAPVLTWTGGALRGRHRPDRRALGGTFGAAPAGPPRPELPGVFAALDHLATLR